MSVVINEFEVIAEPPPASPQPAPGRTQAEESRPIRVIDIVRIMERERQRLERVCAD